MKSLSCKVGIILLSIGLFVFIGYFETFGVKWIYLCEKLPASSYRNQQRIVCASRNIVRVRVESHCKEKSIIEIGARLGHRKWFSKSEDIPIILFLFIAVWGTAIILALGVILYFIVIEPIIKRKDS